MTCHAQISAHPPHHIEIRLDLPPGYARCRGCGRAMTALTWAETDCPRPPIPCARCGAAVYVPGPDHALMRFLGTLCPACYAAQDAARRLTDD